MILVDANLLLHAYDPRSTDHEASRAWLEDVLSGSQFVRFASLTVWAFLRISTNSRVFCPPSLDDGSRRDRGLVACAARLSLTPMQASSFSAAV